MASVAERLRALEQYHAYEGAPGLRPKHPYDLADELVAIRTEVEAVAWEMRQLRDMDPETQVVQIVNNMAYGVIDWSARLAPEETP